MTETHAGGKMHRAVLASSILGVAILAIGTASWLTVSQASAGSELYIWYNPAAGFQSAALPVGFEDLVDRVKPTVVGVRAKMEQDADGEEWPLGGGAPSNRSELPKGASG
jgi:hypothetical protein